jgi:hypothetical protein
MRVFFFLLLCLFPAIAEAATFRSSLFNSAAAATGCSYTPPLDTYSGYGWSTRALTTAQIGVKTIRIRRSSDNTQKDLAPVATTCDINQSDVFFDGSTYYVAKLYAQGTGGVDLVNSNNNATQPVLTLNTLNGHPVINFTAASSQVLSGAALANGVTSANYAVVYDITDTTSARTAFTISLQYNLQSGIDVGYDATNKCYMGRRSTGTSYTQYEGYKTCSANTWYRVLSCRSPKIKLTLILDLQPTR